MARYKTVDRNPRLLPVVLSEQIQPGTFEFALDHLIDHELDLSALDARIRNDATGASKRSPDAAKRNPGLTGTLPRIPACGLHPGYSLKH